MTCPGYGQLLFNHLIQSGLKHRATLWIVMEITEVLFNIPHVNGVINTFHLTSMLVQLFCSLCIPLF